MENRPNFYGLLELEPSANDWAKIEAAIMAKRRTWSMQKNQGSPTQRRKAERYLKLIPEMQSLLKDEQNRKQEADAYRKELDKEKKSQQAHLDELISNIHGTSVSPDLIKKLIRETGKRFTEQEIEKRLSDHGIRVQRPGEGSRKKSKSRPKLEPSVAKGIRDELNTLKLQDLYEFLNQDGSSKVTKRSSASILYERADEIYKELSRIGKTDADTTLRMGLTGRAKSAFANDQEKQRYDNSLETEALAGLDSHLEIVGDDKFIDAKEIDSLLSQSKKLGISNDLALEYIEGYAAKRKWGVQRDGPKRQPVRLCGFCNTPAASPSDTRCGVCGEELTQPCPKCGHPTPSENSACTKCGFHTGDAPLVKSLLREAKRIADEGEYSQAIDRVKRALHYWADWSEALEEKKRIEALREESRAALKKIETLIDARHLQQAADYLEQFISKFGETVAQDAHSRIQQGLRKAKTSFDFAERLRREGKTDLSYDKYEEALSWCADYAPAKQAMAHTPPPAPGAAHAVWRGNTLHLYWQPPRCKGQLSYQVLRKADGVPTGPNDGKLIANTSHSECDDAGVRPGEVFYYAVFTIRFETPSKSFASSGPHLLVKDVSGAHARSGNRQISIQWTPPPGNVQIEVWRKEGEVPSGKGDGTSVSPSGDALLDNGLQNMKRYGYLILTKYPNPGNGALYLYSKGVGITAVPAEPPKPVEGLKAKRQGNRIFLDWPPMDRTQVQIRETTNPPSFTPGEIISPEEAERFGTPIPVASNGKAQAELKSQGRIHFIPISIHADTWVLGSPAYIVTLEDVSNLQAKTTGNDIRLTWDWPRGAREALVAYHHKRFPRTDDHSGAGKKIVTRHSYEHDNHWELRNATRKKHFFTVFVKDPNADAYSAGAHVVETMGQEALLRYRIVTKKNILTRKLKAAWVEFSGDMEEPLPSMFLVLNPNHPPLTATDGLVISKIDRARLTNGAYQEYIPDEFFGRKGYIKVFFQDSKYAKEIRLMPSSKQHLRLD